LDFASVWREKYIAGAGELQMTVVLQFNDSWLQRQPKGPEKMFDQKIGFDRRRRIGSAIMKAFARRSPPG
jgi:hypothetical protein